MALSCRFRAAGVGDHRGLTISVGWGPTSSRDRGHRRASQPQPYRKTVPDIRDLLYLDVPFDEPKLMFGNPKSSLTSVMKALDDFGFLDRVEETSI